MRLRHAGDLANIGVVVRMIDDKQIAVTYLIGTILCLSFAMAVGRVAGNTAVAHPSRPQAFARLLFKGIEVFKEVLARIEVLFHASSIPHGRGGSGIAGFIGGA